MALSNIFREPRREIIESVVGTVAVLGFLYPDYYFGCWIQQGLENLHHHEPGYWHGFFVVGMMLGVGVVVLAYPILFVFPHFVGEVICGLLAAAGLELRPRERRRG